MCELQKLFLTKSSENCAQLDHWMFVTEILFFAQPHPIPLFNIFIKNFMTTVSYCITPAALLLLSLSSPFLVGRLLRKISKLSQTASERKFKCYLRSFPLVKSFYFLSIFPKALLINSRKFNFISQHFRRDFKQNCVVVSFFMYINTFLKF